MSRRGRPRRSSAVALAVAVVVGSVLAVAPAVAADDGDPVVGRVLVLALPTLTWSDLHTGATPHLDLLVDRSAVAALSVRAIAPLTDAADAYATIGAGTRTRGVPTSGLVLAPDEPFRWATAGDVFAATRGTTVDDGLLGFAAPSIASRNRGLDYDSVPGALAVALAESGVGRAVIANADGGAVAPATAYDRVAGTALMDPEGRIPAGSTSPELLEPSTDAAFGQELRIDAVLEAFDLAWQEDGVVLVEASDLVRVDRYRPQVTPEQAEVMRARALRRTDELVGRLLDRVDPEQDAVLAIGPYHRSGTTQLTVAALRAPGVEPGLLESGSTRRSGLVALVDVAPTILSLVGVERPSSMEGRPFERSVTGPATGKERAAHLVRIEKAAKFRDHMVAPVALAFVLLQAVLLVGAAVALQRRRSARSVVGVAALAMLSYLPLTYLAGLAPFHRWPTLAYWGFVLGGSILLALGATVVGRRRGSDPLLVVLFVVFGLLVVDMLLGARLQLNTVFGYSPTVGGRFAGMGNLAFGQFAGAAFLIFGLLTRRVPGPFARWLGLGVLGVAVLIDGMPIWGSDVGGVLALVPAFGITIARLLGQRVRWRSLLVWGSAAVAAVGFFTAIDLARPADERTHLGRLAEAIGNEGFGALETVITRKLGANLSVITSSVWTAMVPIALGFVVYLLWRAPGQIRAVRDSVRECLPGLAVVGVLGFALNDSGIAVPGVMLGVVNASLVYITVRVLPEPPNASGPDLDVVSA